MAFENLFIHKKHEIAGVSLDAIITESHTSDVNFTENPVEWGAEITDHGIIVPKRLEIEARVSDTPLGFAAIGAIVDTITNLFGSSTSENLTRSQQAYRSLVEAQERRSLLTVQTGLKIYKDMVITSIEVEQDVDTSRVADMKISMREVIIVSTETEVVYKEINDPTTKVQADAPAKKGRQQAKPVNDATKRSVTGTIFDQATGAYKAVTK